MQMNVGSGGNHFFGRANGDSTLEYLFAWLDVSNRDLVADSDVLREYDFMSINEVAIAGTDGLYDYEHIVVAMNAQQLLRFSFRLHQNFPWRK